MGKRLQFVCASMVAVILALSSSPLLEYDGWSRDCQLNAEMSSAAEVPSTAARLINTLSCEWCNEHAVLITEQAGEREYFIILGNQRRTLLRTDSSVGIESDFQILAQLRDSLVRKLETDFKMDMSCSPSRGIDAAKTRPAKLGELLALVSAVEKSYPSNLATCSIRSRSIPVIFLQEPYSIGAMATWSMDKSGRAVVRIEPGELLFPAELERAIIHELSHQACYRLGWRQDQDYCWKYFKRLGWQKFFNPSTGEQGYRILTKDGAGFKRSDILRCWVKCDTQGRPLSAENQICRQPYAEQLLSAEMKVRALVEPATSYFPNPMEHMAEAMTLYRLSPFSRKYLEAEFPQLYRIVADADQEEIDKTFGHGNYVRTPNEKVASCYTLSGPFDTAIRH